MPGVTRLHLLLSRYYGCSKTEAELLVTQGFAKVDNKTVAPSTKIEYWQQVTCKGEIIQQGKTFSYLKMYKPRGIECTKNKTIAGNIYEVIDPGFDFHFVGRLDKASEGLVILTDDGSIFNAIANSSAHQEKEYIVQTAQPFDDAFLENMRSGVTIMGQQTRAADVWRINETPDTFGIILTQGLNRQIRRMCNKLGHEVVFLKRIRIANILLGDLQPGTTQPMQQEELDVLFKMAGLEKRVI